MPIQVVAKPKTRPEYIVSHPMLVPLRVADHKASYACTDDRSKRYAEDAPIGSLCFGVPSHVSVAIFSLSAGRLLDPEANDHIVFVRAYDVEQIVIFNDDSPAPVL
jgi:hypothetical protein